MAHTSSKDTYWSEREKSRNVGEKDLKEKGDRLSNKKKYSYVEEEMMLHSMDRAGLPTESARLSSVEKIIIFLAIE